MKTRNIRFQLEVGTWFKFGNGMLQWYQPHESVINQQLPMLLLNRKQILTIFWYHFVTQYMGIIGTLLDLVDMQLI